MGRIPDSKPKLFATLTLGFLIAIPFPATLFAQRAEKSWPEPGALLKAARLSATARPMLLDGRLRFDREVVPFRLAAGPGRIRYDFPTIGETFDLEFGPDAPRLQVVTAGGGSTPADPEALIGDTGLARGELALEFLYWSDAVIEREETVKTRKCFLLRINAPARSARYMVVFAWIDQVNGAIMRMEGHDWNGKLVRRFEVISAQKSSIGWILKQMRIQIIDPETGRTTRRIYLEILDEKTSS